MAEATKKLDELFHDTLKDMYYAERKIVAALPMMAKASQNQELAAAFEKHRGETERQIARLEQVFQDIGKKPEGKRCAAIDGILERSSKTAFRSPSAIRATSPLTTGKAFIEACVASS